jgi:hypothetical protein
MTNKKQKPEADNPDGTIGVGSGDLLDHSGVIAVNGLGLMRYEVEILPQTGQDVAQVGQPPTGSAEASNESSATKDWIALEWKDKSRPTLRGLDAMLEIQRRSRLLRKKLGV